MRILLATDGSKASLNAAAFLDALPLESECSLRVLTVIPQAAEDGEPVLRSTLDVLAHTAAAPEPLTRRGHATEEILRAAEEHPTDLIVLGSEGAGGLRKRLLGSVAERVARYARTPVLVVRGASGPLGRLVVGVDGSRGAERATRWLSTFPLPSDVELRLVSILPNLRELEREHALVTPPLVPATTTLADLERNEARSSLEAAVAILSAPGRHVTTEIRSGDPAPGLLQVAEDEGTDLLVVGHHGQSALERFLLGSVAEELLHHAHCSVLVVR